MSDKIEMGKTYRTRDGREVRIYAVDGGGHYPIHGAIRDGDDWSHETWTADGVRHMYRPHGIADLIEVKPKIVRAYWLAHSGAGGAVVVCNHDAANTETYPRAIAITGPYTITFTEGEGL